MGPGPENVDVFLAFGFRLLRGWCVRGMPGEEVGKGSPRLRRDGASHFQIHLSGLLGLDAFESVLKLCASALVFGFGGRGGARRGEVAMFVDTAITSWGYLVNKHGNRFVSSF